MIPVSSLVKTSSSLALKRMQHFSMGDPPCFRNNLVPHDVDILFCDTKRPIALKDRYSVSTYSENFSMLHRQQALCTFLGRFELFLSMLYPDYIEDWSKPCTLDPNTLQIFQLCASRCIFQASRAHQRLISAAKI